MPREAPIVPELVGGVELSPTLSGELSALGELVANAEYWLSFDLARFEPIIEHMPAPLRQLAVGIALRFGEAPDGRLHASDLERFRAELLERLPGEVRSGLAAAAETLARTVAARDRTAALEAEGFATYKPATALSVHALRASGRSVIRIDGIPPLRGGATEVEVGKPLALDACDDRGRPLGAPEIESPTHAPVLTRDERDRRHAVFTVPGSYVLRVPGKLEGDRKLLAR